MVDRWWQDKPGERYWLEATDREDIGADLKAPDEDAGGRDNTLFRFRRGLTTSSFTMTAGRGRSSGGRT
jgi:hypothetical protein